MSVGYQNGGKSQQPEARTGAQGSETADLGTLKGDVGDIATAEVERGRTSWIPPASRRTGYVDLRHDVAPVRHGFAHSLREATSSFDDRPNIAPLWTARPRASISSRSPFASARSTTSWETSSR